MSDYTLNYYVSLWNYAHYDVSKSIEDVIEEIVAQGYGVELWPHFASLDPYRPTMYQDKDLFNAAYRKRLLRMLKSIRSCWHCRLYGPGGSDYENTVLDYKEQIDVAAELGSEIISIHRLGEGTSEEDYLGADPDFSREVLAYAQERHVSIAMETGAFSPVKSAMEQLADLRICLDPSYIHSYHQPPIQAYMQAFGSRIVYLHLYDFIAPNSHHITPGDGEIPVADWLYMLAALKAMNFQGPAAFEILPPPWKSRQTPLQTVEDARQFFEKLSAQLA
jgi:sugar phosphate isomerase/epimerase